MMEPTILIKDATYIVTMNQQRQILHNQSLLIEGNRIAEVGTVTKSASRVIDAKDKIVLPGFINGHHHLFQAFMRHVPEMQNQRIDKWIDVVSKLGKKMDPEAHYHAALINMIELLFSGCTTTSDMLYLFAKPYAPREIFTATIQAARDCGIRFHPFRGSMSLSSKDGAQFDDDVVETSVEIVHQTRTVIKTFHDPARDAMVKVGIAPCTIFTSTADDYSNAFALAKEYDVNLQTHLSESTFEQEYAQSRYGKRPLEYIRALGWQSPRVSFAHCIEANDHDMDLLAQMKMSVVHCPISNSRKPIGQAGIAPIWEMLEKGINVAIGVDGSAGSDSSNVLEEMRWARTLQGARKEATYLRPMDVLAFGTINGAHALRWNDMLGSIEVGKCADIAIFDTEDSIAHVGAWDEVGALLSCQALSAHTVLVNGKLVIRDGTLQTLDQNRIVQKARDYWKHIFKDKEIQA